MVLQVGNLVIRSKLDVEGIRQNVLSLKREFQSAAGEVGGLFGGITSVAKQAGLAATNFAKLGTAGLGALGGLAIAFGPSSQVALERFGLQMEQTGRIADRIFGPALNKIADTTESLIPVLDRAISKVQQFQSSVNKTPESDVDFISNALVASAAAFGLKGANVPKALGGGKLGFLRPLGAVFGGLTAAQSGLLSSTPPASLEQAATQIGSAGLTGASIGGLAGGAIGLGVSSFVTALKFLGKFTDEAGDPFSLSPLGFDVGPQSTGGGKASTIVIQANEVRVEGGGLGPAL